MTAGDSLPSGPRLDDEQFRRLAAYGHVERAEAGQELYATGDDSYDLFLLRSATVDIVREATAIEPEHRIYQGRPGDFLGELSLLTGQHVYLTARVMTAGAVVRVGAAMLRRVLAEQVDIADVLIEAFRARRDTIRAAAGNALAIVGRAGDAAALDLRTYVTQLFLPHAWLDATAVSGLALMRSAGIGDADLPAAVITGSVLQNATPGAVAEALGLTYRSDGRSADLVVVGGGPAGLAAAVYAASEGLVTVLLDRSGIGGQAAKSARIENYLGFPQGVSGEYLTRLAWLTVTGRRSGRDDPPQTAFRGDADEDHAKCRCRLGAWWRSWGGTPSSPCSGRCSTTPSPVGARPWCCAVKPGSASRPCWASRRRPVGTAACACSA